MIEDDPDTLDTTIDSDERRDARRIPFRTAAWVARDGARVDMQTQNISLGGVCISGETHWTTGDTLEVSLAVDGQDEPLTLKGHVAWRRDTWVGVEFDDIPGESEASLQATVNHALNLAADDD